MKRNSKSGLFLLELLLSLVIFSVCAGICVLVFAKASGFTAESRDLSNCTLLAQNAAESVKSGLTKAEDSVTFYDRNLCETDRENGSYRLDVTFGEERQNIRYFHVAVFSAESDEIIFEIDSAVLAAR